MRINLGENAQMAITTLRENKMRSFLTVLGVVIGITALISVVSILVGVYGSVNDYLSDYGTETLFIFRFDPGIHAGRLTAEERARKPLTLEDAEAIEQLCPAVRSVTVSLYPRLVAGDDGPPSAPVTARYLNKEVAGIDYYGTLPATEEVFNSRPRIGRFFSKSENAHSADVAVIGSDIAKTLYPDMDPLGKPIMVEGVTYEVIGVLEPRKGGFVKDQSADRGVMVPYRSYHKHIPQDDEHFVGATAFPGLMSEAEDQIRG
ncbi:MAG TPA: ABC transporter permease, partial [Candidatus Bathyarchaeia archaeon]|nr:ABC transporter permease [Candidatus Bathyarchaeia archaeon]